MSLAIGHKLAHYEILEPIGKGGMGEVYQAHDSKLGRDVAIKVLPDELAQDEERLRRFQREAKVLASLNHPNIAAIYGLEHDDDIHYLVMELVPGETLAERISRGPIPVGATVEIAARIAEGLEDAHEQGIVHRDLKPANVKVTPKGTVKVLDFGLAKALEGKTTSSSESPTMTSEGTRAGTILGTPAYMAPEQARGEVVDQRVDIWAFGCIVYEMLTGRGVFARKTVSETVASVLTGEVDWTALPRRLPPALRIMLRRCLEKDVRRRLPHMGAARLDLADATTLKETEFETARRSSGAPVVAGLAVVIVALTMAWFALNRLGPSDAPSRVTRVSIDPSPGESWVINPHDPDIAISPDGERIAYTARREDEIQLVVRRLDEFESRALGSFGGSIRQPFFSPDGDWIGIVDGNVLKRVAVDGSAAVTICALPMYLSGATWAPDGTIIFGTLTGGLFRVPSAGGEPAPLTTPAGFADRWPVILPGGEAVLFASSSGNASDIRVRSLTSGEEKVVVEGATFPLYARTGHLLYVQNGVLWGIGFDVERLELLGDAAPVLDRVMIKGSTDTGLGAANIGIAHDGTLVYRPSRGSAASTLVWVDRDGREEPLNLAPRGYGRLQLTGDGTRIAVEVTDSDTKEANVWVGRLDGTPLTQLTYDPAPDGNPVFTPDGRYVLFASRREGGGVFRKRWDGSGPVERLLPAIAGAQRVPLFVTPDGDALVYYQVSRVSSTEYEWSVNRISLSGDHDIESLPLQFPINAAISPDGGWVAYISDETGDYEVYVQPYPNPENTKWRITSGGGRDPLWSRDGRELFYLRDNTMFALGTTTAPSFSSEPAVALFDSPYLDASGRYYDVAPDGKFLMIKPGWVTAGGETSLHVVLNWVAELERLVPTDD